MTLVNILDPTFYTGDLPIGATQTLEWRICLREVARPLNGATEVESSDVDANYRSCQLPIVLVGAMLSPLLPYWTPAAVALTSGAGRATALRAKTRLNTRLEYITSSDNSEKNKKSWTQRGRQ
ncbi:hypothetical protein DL546_000785 [Coniochaeta pulveracea]|uniref:Uncharacterized protein n=1 Tax=Coniochaeta pulveracea TaxID=177199 RepID=A0A420XX20_9PEZI|nr:hypothetical protein DL546_000785 [Coniochaeta pulveracea]